jgi:hypothetical protein
MALWLDGSPVDDLTALQLGGLTVGWLDGLMARRLAGLTARRLDGLTAWWFNGRRRDGLPARRTPVGIPATATSLVLGQSLAPTRPPMMRSLPSAILMARPRSLAVATSTSLWSLSLVRFAPVGIPALATALVLSDTAQWVAWRPSRAPSYWQTKSCRRAPGCQ